MALSFAELRASRTENLAKLSTQLAKVNSNQTFKSDDDERLWKPTLDKAGNGFAVIRFLPAPAGEDDPFVRMFSHGFKGPTNSWYIENSRTTLGIDDPVGELNSKLWNSGVDSDKEIARAQKRRLHFYSNIYVVKDPANPENEGKVFLYKYGKKIFNKLNSAMNPEFQDEKSMNPFDLWEGANFKLKIRKGDYGSDYEKSEFDDVAPLATTDEAMEAIWAKAYSLQEIVAEKNFKSYDELLAKMNKVLGLDKKSGTVAPTRTAEPKVGKSVAAAEEVEVEGEDESNIDELLNELNLNE